MLRTLVQRTGSTSSGPTPATSAASGDMSSHTTALMACLDPQQSASGLALACNSTEPLMVSLKPHSFKC